MSHDTTPDETQDTRRWDVRLVEGLRDFWNTHPRTSTALFVSLLLLGLLNVHLAIGALFAAWVWRQPLPALFAAGVVGGLLMLTP